MRKRLYHKYDVTKVSGKPIDPKAQYFVLRIDSDPADQRVTAIYADEMEKVGEDMFADQLREWISKFTEKPARTGMKINPEHSGEAGHIFKNQRRQHDT